MFRVDQIVAEHYPALAERPFYRPLLRPILRRMLHEEEFFWFAERYHHLHGIDFVEQALDYFDCSYAVSARQRENIPATGRVVIIANHPIGSLDGLCLLKLIDEIRSDVRIVANHLLHSLVPLRSCLLPVRNMTGNSSRQHLRRISQALENEEAVIIFPAGEVSRIKANGIRDGHWRPGFLKLAEAARAPILPIHVAGRNSSLFYLSSLVAKPLSTLLLVGEMFRQPSRQLQLTIGRVIPWKHYQSPGLSRREKVRVFKKHLYNLGAGKRPLFTTESAIAPRERRIDLKKELGKAELLGKTPDGKKIFLFQPDCSSVVMREIGCLRELAFRAVGEGTGHRRDMDGFDWYYRHLFLWDEEGLEIAGAYRFVDSAQVLREKGTSGLYSASLFNYGAEHAYFLENGLELGRSFVQPRYWGNRSLDYLWFGIGAFLRENPGYRYLFGPVSISAAMPPAARELLVYFYRLYFGAPGPNPCSRNPFSYSQPLATLAEQFAGNDYRADFRRLKNLLANLGTAVPPLYKQYAELCDPGGVVFVDFNIDPAFNNCIDGLVIVDTHRLKAKKRQRYIETAKLF
jgi:putative hemolysin